MPDSSHKTLVGVFGLSALVLLSFLVFMFGGGRTFFAATYDVNVHFPDQVVGVQPGQSVSLNGKRIGETKEVEFWDANNLDAGLRVVIAVEEKYTIPSDSIMYVAANLMGLGKPQISIWVQTSTSPKLSKDGEAILSGRMMAPLDQVLKPEIQQKMLGAVEQIGKLAESLRPVGDNLARMLASRNLQDVDQQKIAANLDTVVQRIDEAFKSFNQLIGDEKNRTNLEHVLANLRTMSENGVNAMKKIEELSGEGANVARTADELLRRVAGTLDTVASLAQQLNTAAATINSKEGTVGLLLNDKRLYEEMVLTARRLTRALDDIREVMDIAKQGKLRIRAL